MALNTYSALKASVANWLNRTDLTSEIVDFITLAEAEMKRRLRRSSTRTTITISAEETTPPSDMAELRDAYLETGSPSADVPLRVATPAMLAERRARSAGTTGRPSDIAYIAGKLVVAPTPDQSYTARIHYFTQLTALSDTNATNDVLDEAPDAYLFGALWQAEYFLEHEEAAAKWERKFLAAIDQLNEVRDREEFAATATDVRLPRVFG